MTTQVPISEVQLEKIRYGTMTALSPMMLHDLDVGVSTDVISGMFAARMTGYIYGKRGLTATDTRTVVVPKFPRWMPEWLRKRWTTERTVRLDCTPMVVFPEVPRDVFPGTPRVAYFDKGGE
jgi:hypothetical protein